MNNNENLKNVGEFVTARLNGGDVVTGRILGAYQDIKDGRPGYDLDCGRWCYADQVVR